MSRKAIVGALLTCMCGALGCAARLPDEVVWARQFGTAQGDEARAVCVDSTGVYVVGVVEGALPGERGAGKSDAFVRKYDFGGVKLWTRQFGGQGWDSAAGCCAGRTGIYVVGHTQRTVAGEGASRQTQAFISKYDTDGTEQWTRQFGVVAIRDAGPVVVSSDGPDVYVAGGISAALPGQTSGGGGDAFVRKYDAEGNEVWTRQFGGPRGDWATAVCAHSGAVYIAGRTCGGLSGQPKADERVGFVAKYDSAGKALWTRQFGATYLDSVHAVWADASGVYVAGETEGVLPGQVGTRARRDAFLKKYAPDGRELWTRQFGTGHPMYARALVGSPGGVLVAGSMVGSFSRGWATGQWDAFVRAYSPTGTVLRTTQFGDGKLTEALAIAVGEDGVYVAGATYSALPGHRSRGGPDAFVAKVIVPEAKE